MVYRNYSSKNRASIKGFPLHSIIIAGVVFISTMILILYFSGVFEGIGKGGSRKIEQAMALWKQKQYDEVIKVTGEMLESDPLHKYALALHGFAYYYTGLWQVIEEEKIDRLEKAVVSLRKSLLYGNHELSGNIFYVLGQTYYHKGKYYLDTSVHYLEKSLESDFTGPHIHEYLSLAYAGLNNYEESVYHFKKAIEIGENNKYLLYRDLAQTYINWGKLEDAEKYLEKVISEADDADIIEKSRFLLGDVYYKLGDFNRAEEQYKSILEMNPQSAEAYYQLGEVYRAVDEDPLHARARGAWRKARELDPDHLGALKRLNE
jgi:FimV-like protein